MLSLMQKKRQSPSVLKCCLVHGLCLVFCQRTPLVQSPLLCCTRNAFSLFVLLCAAVPPITEQKRWHATRCSPHQDVQCHTALTVFVSRHPAMQYPSLCIAQRQSFSSHDTCHTVPVVLCHTASNHWAFTSRRLPTAPPQQ